MGLLLLFALFLSLGSCVHDLNELTLPRLNNGDSWLVVFHTTWCQFCQAVVPVLDQISAKPNLPFRVARVDCTSRIPLCSSLGFSVWPSIVAMKNESLWMFHGTQRDESALSHFARVSLGESDIAPDRKLRIPGVADLVWQRLEKEADVARQDLLTLYENYDDSVKLIALVGVLVGVLLGALTWRHPAKRKQD